MALLFGILLAPEYYPVNTMTLFRGNSGGDEFHCEHNGCVPWNFLLVWHTIYLAQALFRENLCFKIRLSAATNFCLKIWHGARSELMKGDKVLSGGDLCLLYVRVCVLGTYVRDKKWLRHEFFAYL